jgi:quercetin dioxygenase-like cupin family protein
MKFAMRSPSASPARGLRRLAAGAAPMNADRKTRRRTWFAATVAFVVIASLSVVYVSGALATAPSGVTTVPIAVGRFDANINVKAKTDINPGHRVHNWKARIKTKLATDVYVLQNTIVPGGTFGWHSHPGPSLVIVKSGTATFYMGDDPTCAPHVVAAGSGFVDDGQDVHVVRNEGSIDLVTVVVSLVPAGFARRIDKPSPGNCPF